MGLKSWLVGLGLFGVTSGAVAQSTEQKAEDKKTDTVEATVTGQGKINTSPVIKPTDVKYDIGVNEEGVPTIKLKVPRVKIKKTELGKALEKDSLSKVREKVSSEENGTNATTQATSVSVSIHNTPMSVITKVGPDIDRKTGLPRIQTGVAIKLNKKIPAPKKLQEIIKDNEVEY